MPCRIVGTGLVPWCGAEPTLPAGLAPSPAPFARGQGEKGAGLAKVPGFDRYQLPHAAVAGEAL